MVDTAQVLPPLEMLRLWAEHLIPAPGDVWYWDTSPLDFDLTGCQVMTREAYREDATYNTIAYDNAYLSWKMPAEVTQVIVSDHEWIGNLPDPIRQRVLQKQVDLQRGLVFTAGWFGELPTALRDYVVADAADWFAQLPPALQVHAVADVVVLARAVWASLPFEIKQRALLAEQRRWDEVDCYPVPEDAPTHVRAVANTFIPQEGTNCFAIATYGATADSELLATWLKVSPLELVTPLGYRQVPDSTPIADDIVIFERADDLIHAAWCAGNDRFLNKNGQSWFNPVRIVDWKMLKAEWPEATRMTIYRRGEASTEE